jgi:hypothetical protein
VGSVTLHPAGIPHGPHPGLAEKSIGMTETHGLAVMCDTFHPLKRVRRAGTADTRRTSSVPVPPSPPLRLSRYASPSEYLAMLAPVVGLVRSW